MPALYITEYSQMAMVDQAQPGTLVQMYSKGQGQAAQAPPVAEQVISISGSPTQSVAFNAQTKFIRVNCDTVCSIAFGSNPTATTSNQRLAANQTEYFGVARGDKISVIQNV